MFIISSVVQHLAVYILHALCKQIKDCYEDQRDTLFLKNTILQALNTKGKSFIPGYLKYRDRGSMYFPNPVFIS